MANETEADHYKGLKGWVSDHKKMVGYGNTKGAAEVKKNIDDKIKQHKLDAKKVWGDEVNEGRYPTKQSPKMKALADKAEEDAAEERAKPKKKVMKKTNESTSISNLAFLVESELEKATVISASEGILSKLEKMASELASIEADDILPILSSMRLTYGAELTDHFHEVTIAKIRGAQDAVMAANEGVSGEVARMTAVFNGEPANDMAMGGEEDDSMGGVDDGSMGGDDDAGMGMDGAEGDMGDMGGDDLGGMDGDDLSGHEPAAGGDDLDAAFDAAAGDSSMNAAGRSRKESVERNVKALSESANPDRLVFETFRRTLRESGDAVRSAKAVATAFAIDFQDVVAIVKEGKTYKDEHGKTGKDKDRTQARKDKKRDRPTELDEGKAEVKVEKKSPYQGVPQWGITGDSEMTPSKATAQKWANAENNAIRAAAAKKVKAVEEGKTYKDEKGKSTKDKDYSQDRKDKKRDRPTELDEGEFVKGEKGVNPFAKKDDKAERKGDGRKVDPATRKVSGEKVKEASFGGGATAKPKVPFGKRAVAPGSKSNKDLDYYSDLENRGMKEGKDVFDKHQKAIALKTLKMSDAGANIMGGMSKAEARSFLKAKCGFSDARIAKLEESVNESVGDDRKAELKKMGYKVAPATTDASKVKTAKWFWRRDKNDTMHDHIQDGTSDTEDAAWSDLHKHAKPRVDEAMPDFLKSKLDGEDKKKDDRKAKGFGAIEDEKKKKKVDESDFYLDFDSIRREAFVEAAKEETALHTVSWYKGTKGSPEGGEFLTRDKAKADAKAKEKRDAGFEVDCTESKSKAAVEEDTDGAKVLVMQHGKRKDKPFSKPFVRKTPAKK
jgi:hypothetical protein